MRRRLTTITLAGACLITLHTAAQQPAPVRMHLQTDQNVYISGDDAWVDGWTEKSMDNSRFTRLRLLDRNGKTRTETFLPIYKGAFTGYVSLPDDLPTDTYFLDAIASAIPSSCRLTPILVVNPRIPPASGCRNPPPEKMSPVQARPADDIRLRLEKDRFDFQSPVSLNWSVTDGRPIHDIACLAFRSDAVSQRMDSLSKTFQHTLTHPNVDPRDDLGHLIRVKITRNGRPVAQQHAMAALKGSHANISSALSDSQGILEFLIPRTFDPSRLVIIPETDKPGDLQWEWLERDQPSPIPFPCFPWEASLKPDIEDRILNSRLEQRYHPEGVRSVEMSETDSSDFYGKPDHRYLLDDYTRFPVMEEVFTEIIPQLRIRKDNGRPTLLMLNAPFKAYFPKQALILLDGIPVSEGQSILDIDPLRIRSIDVVSRSFTLGHTEYPGILHLKSYRADMAGVPQPQGSLNAPFPGIQRPTTYPEPESKRPSLRNLLWKEQVRAPEGLKSMDMRFPTSDATGSYRIRISGTDARGNRLQGETSIFVGQGQR